MQALVVINKAKEHEYMREFSTNPSVSTQATLRYLQDLYLVEYCCRLVCAHESQMGNTEILETLEHLNSTVLRPIYRLQVRSRINFKGTFQLHQDPLVDYTLALLTRSWNQLMLGRDSRSSSQSLSTEKAALASASLPFLRAIVERRLFPSTTYILHDVAMMHGSGPNSRMTVLDICLSANDHMGAMRWIWLWDRRDRSDWLDQWNQLDIKQWLVAQFSESSQLDWTMDLFRIVNRASGTPHLWIQDFLTTMSDNSLGATAHKGYSLKEILSLSSMDVIAFVKKKQFYNLDSWKQLDHLQSWLSGLQGLDLDFRLDRNSVEHPLWREMVMVGVLSKVLAQIDIVRSVDVEVLAAIRTTQSDFRHHPTDGISIAASSSELYRDPLTDYLGRKTINDQDISLAKGDQMITADLEAIEASLSLKSAIQQVMDRYRSEDISSQTLLNSYRDLLHNVASHATVRLGHLGLVSLVTEARFRSTYGNHLWNQTVFNSLNPDSISKDVPNHAWAEGGASIMPEVLIFLRDHMRPTLARLCASIIQVVESSMGPREGRFSDWFMTMAECSVTTGPMARVLQSHGRFDPKSRAYHQAMNILLELQEFHLAVDLHSSVYRLLEDMKSLGDHVARPDVKELGMLIHQLATCDIDPGHLDQAQWIFDRHLERERALAESGRPSSEGQLIDIHILTVLGGAWFRRAEFKKARSVLETMWTQGLQPNMILYNTLLKALVDLTPYAKAGKRVMGTGTQVGMRERGREIMVRQLVKSKSMSLVGSSGDLGNSATAEWIRSELEEGWDIFQSIISMASQQSPEMTMPAEEAYAPSILRRLMIRTKSEGRLMDGNFRPDSYTFSILLGAFARRGQIESISELFVEMKQLSLEPDVVICSILANAFAKRGDLKAMDRVIQEARIRGLDPGLYLTNVVLDSLVEMGVSASKIRETLDGIIKSASRMEELMLEDEVEISVQKFDGTHSRCKANGSKGLERGLDGVTLTTLIKYHARQNDTSSAQELFRLMVEAGVVPDSRVYVLFLGASIRTQDIATGIWTLRAMRIHSGVLPDAKAWKGLLRCALELEMESERQQHVQSRLKGRYQQSRKVRLDESSPSELFPGMESGRSPPEELSQSLKEEGPVITVLKELESVLFDIGTNRVNPALSIGDHAGMTTKKYMHGILTSSWVPLSDKNYSDSGHAGSEVKNGRRQPLNIEVKGKNSLLRRLLNHLLREPSFNNAAARVGQEQQQEYQHLNSNSNSK
ncbi:hypothetical protein BGZ65_008689 [Modicella reniformis]|uniref:Pentatricopeptide repeat-containing protein n=1 Tax=Modicella reniformis TaxID=1440133 RepID=A0A9P6SPC4_9FUNG|nr:hypothetical protein BGZ65_008689 [Modicella reniformis]